MGSDWWKRLPADGRREYERSNAISEVPLPHHEGFPKVIGALVEALAVEDAAEVQRVSNVLVRGICRTLKTARAVVRVASERPHNAGGELHGLYDPGEDGSVAHITVWMRTAKRGEVVAPRTFLRTLLHEVVHHLDMELFDLPESYHSRGFYRRESSLYRILTQDTDLAPRRRGGRGRVHQRASAAPAGDLESREQVSSNEGLAMLRAVADEIRQRRRNRSGPESL